MITEATDYAYEAGQMRLLGDVLNMRALLYRRQQRFEDALQTHYTSLEYWLLSGNYYGIQGFYHNLACWCSDSAKSLPTENADGKQALIHAAIQCANTSMTMCNKYDIGQNSRLTEVLLADLHAECGDFGKAIESAKAAWKGATSTGSRYEMAMAAYKILKLHLWRKQYSEAGPRPPPPSRLDSRSGRIAVLSALGNRLACGSRALDVGLDSRSKY